MFRRLWTGLPKDVSFPSDLKSLGLVYLKYLPYIYCQSC